ncbi:proto-oncogene Mas-like [Bufo gargarizans]|uniref:proto-oncogene Mas-like n=1 Tax=Bufo gargarizans TaxID=30331 RepID=UPI001CF4099F|nr:proto-oncogene Mas-like [Bufo gargarizans]XP_044150798.1 proto-oncogene Mas-like [Bufo gargarizans]
MALNNTGTTDLNAEDIDGHSQFAYIHFTIAAAIALLLCLIGLVGNSIVLWYLCFKIQKNKFTTYSINLAVAYFIFLLSTVSVLSLSIHTLTSTHPDFPGKDSLYILIEIIYDSTFYSGIFILTAISLERCISVTFPVWHECHRPKTLSIIMCVILWLVGCLVSLSENFTCTPEAFVTPTSGCTAIQLVTFALAIIVCLPIMVTSCLILIIRIKKKFNQQVSTELYAFIILAVIAFIVSVVPVNFLWLLLYFNLLSKDIQTLALFFASIYGTVLNCTIIPYFYIIAEIKWKAKFYKPEREGNRDITKCKTDSI